MRHIDTIVIGGGQAGLAMSRCLDERGVEHVVLERGRIGERWRSERWDPLHLLTPRWQARLPGWAYQGPDPDGYMSRLEVIDYLERYAGSFTAPIETGVTVRSMERGATGYVVTTDQGSWTARAVVIATGDCDKPFVPGLSRGLSSGITQVVPSEYRNPGQLPEGGVLVVGASATGTQLAKEIHASGRPVTLSVGRHTRLPRHYRGRDILWWLDQMGIFDERAAEVCDIGAARRQPSLQLTGGAHAATLDLGVLADAGIRMVGRTRAAVGPAMTFDDDLVEHTAAADVKLARLRMRIDRHIDKVGLSGESEPAEPLSPLPLWDAPTALHLGAEGIRTVVWATGYRRSYPWLKVPVLSHRGEINHNGGVTPEAGLYVLGLRFLRRRNSNFLDGVARDAEELADHLQAHRRSHGRSVA